MATAALSRHESGALVARTTTDRELLRAFLEHDRLWAAYAICDLDDREFQRTRWGVAFDGHEPVAVGLEYAGTTPQPLFLMGRPDGVDAILRDVVRLRAAYVAALPELLPGVARHYRLDPGPAMVRMWVDRSTFRPASAAADVRRLLPVDIGDLNRLYQLGFASWLPSSSIVEGVYYGLRVGGRLVSAAGTHVVSPAARLAVVGNVLTTAEQRGRGYATAVTGAVTADLLRTSDQVVLNVRADNPPALQAYRKLGYQEHVRFEERLAHRTGTPLAGLAEPIRRWLAGRKESEPR
jgi:GNAT superfamily N-acetyltransferase